MVGIVIAGHAMLSSGLLGAAKAIMSFNSGVVALPYRSHETIREFSERMKAGIAGVEEGEGVLVLTDMYGDSPTNAALRLMSQTNIEVVAGVNLPMLLEALTYRSNLRLSELASKVEGRSRECIVNAGAYFRGQQDSLLRNKRVVGI